MRISDISEQAFGAEQIDQLAHLLGRTSDEVRAMDSDEVFAELDARHEQRAVDVARIAGIPVEQARRTLDEVAELGRSVTRPKPTQPITCPCEAFDRDISAEDLLCYCGHAYDKHSEADDGLPCISTAPYPTGGGS